MASGTRGAHRANEVLRRLLARAREDETVHAEALTALLDCRVFAGTWASSAEAVRTLTNSDGERAMPLFTRREELQEAAPRFGWLNPDGSLSVRELDAYEALQSALSHGVHFVVIDICNAHAVEFGRAEIAEALEAQPARAHKISHPPQRSTRSVIPAKSAGGRSKRPGGFVEMDAPFASRRPPAAAVHMAAVEEIVVPRARKAGRRPDPRVDEPGSSNAEPAWRDKPSRSRPGQPRRANRGSTAPLGRTGRAERGGRGRHASVEEHSRVLLEDSPDESHARPVVDVTKPIAAPGALAAAPETPIAPPQRASAMPPPERVPDIQDAKTVITSRPPRAVAQPTKRSERPPALMGPPGLPSLPSLPSLDEPLPPPLMPEVPSLPEAKVQLAPVPIPETPAAPVAAVAPAPPSPPEPTPEAVAPKPEAAPAAAPPKSDPSALRAPETPLANEVLDAIAEALRKYPEVEWACELADGSGVPVIALRIEPTYMTRADEIRAVTAAAAMTRQVSVSAQTLSSPAAMRQARAQGVAFYPWRKRAVAAKK